MFRIGQAAQLTGVPEHTLRAWERRYGAFRPTRTAGGYRVYDGEAIARIRAMHRLVVAGWAPSAASVEIAQRRPTTSQASGTPADAERLIHALAALDSASAKRIIDQQFALCSYEAVVDDWLMPSLVLVGQAWSTGAISVAGEHLVANIVMRLLAAAFDAVGPNPPGPPAIIGAASGITHELGLMAFAVALRRTGRAAIYLGADTPADAWSDAVRTTGAKISVTAIPRRSDLGRVTALVERLQHDHPQVPVAVGGSYQHLAPAGCRRLGHRIATAARDIAG